MAKATLEFDLNDPDDSMAHMRAVKSTDMAMAIWEIVYNTKKKIEWEIEQSNLDANDTLDKVYYKIWESLEEHGIKIDELIN